MRTARGYQGSYLLGLILIGVVALRNFLPEQSLAAMVVSALLLFGFTVLYGLEPWLSERASWYKYIYFPIQIILVILLTLQGQGPFQDFQTLLYVPLCIQVLRAFAPPLAAIWVVILGLLLTITVMLGLGPLPGAALALLVFAIVSFFFSYDLLYARTRADQAESQRLLLELESAHQRLKEYAAQAEELAAARERNKLARNLHDSISQIIFSITLTSQSARLLLERDPSRVPEQIDRLQRMTEEALGQLRSLIAELHPPQDPSHT